MRSGLTIGSEAELIWEVTAEHVIHLGYPPPTVVGGVVAGDAPAVSAVVFSTPNMILLMERAARKLLQPFLEPGEESVGAMVQVEHLAGTPLGAEVRAVARVTAIQGRSIDFEIAAFDAQEQIGRGTHRRAIVQLERIAKRMAEKSAALTGLAAAVDSSPSELLPVTQALQVEVRGAVATVTLNRPEKKNAVNVQMTEDWERLNRYFWQHPEIRVVLVRGAGDAFCAGDDVIEVGTLSIEQAQELSYRQARMYLAWEQLPQVFIAVVDGAALGAGCVAACACDLRLASHAARFGMPEILLGWPPGYGIAQLTALIGKPRALEMCLCGEPITAQQARDYGLVQRLVPAAALTTAAEQWAEQLLRLPASALRETKRLVHADEGLQPKTAYLADTAAYVRCLQLPDAREGIAAFQAKRPPRYSAEQSAAARPATMAVRSGNATGSVSNR